LSEDDFIPKKQRKVAVTCADVLKESHKPSRKKQGVYIKESEIIKAIADVEEESINSPSYTKVHVCLKLSRESSLMLSQCILNFCTEYLIAMKTFCRI